MNIFFQPGSPGYNHESGVKWGRHIIQSKSHAQCDLLHGTNYENCGKDIHICQRNDESTYLWFSAKCAEKKVEKWKVCQTPQNIKATRRDRSSSGRNWQLGEDETSRGHSDPNPDDRDGFQGWRQFAASHTYHQLQFTCLLFHGKMVNGAQNIDWNPLPVILWLLVPAMNWKADKKPQWICDDSIWQFHIGL